MFNSQTNPEPARWDTFVARHQRGHFLQTMAWAEIKADFGWESQRVALLDDQKNIIAGAQILYRKLPFDLGKLAYIPFGPMVDWENQALVEALFFKIDRTAKRSGAKFLKLEPGYDIDTHQLKKLGNRPSQQTIQPPSTILIDVRRRGADGQRIGEDAILSRMNQMTRRNIRKSSKHDVQVREGTPDDVAKFNALLQTTSERQEFGVHVPAYYEKVYECIVAREDPPKGVLLMASYSDEETGEQKDLAGAFIFALGDYAWYVYGASSNVERNRMASFGIQWAAIQWARQQKVKYYDLYGIPDEAEAFLEEHFNERSDGLWGVYRFKRGWGGQVVRSAGTWDRIYNPMIYRLYRMALFVRSAIRTENE